MASKIREKIVETAVTCFAERGHAGCSTKEIAVRANVTEGSLFRLFKSKKELFRESLDRSVNAVLKPEDYERLLAGEDFRKAYRRAALALFTSYSADAIRLINFALLEKVDDSDHVISAKAEARMNAGKARIQRAIRAKQLRRDVNAEAASRFLYQALYQLRFSSIVLPRSKKSQLALATEYVEMWLRCLQK